MRRLLAFIIVLVLVGVGYFFYTQIRTGKGVMSANSRPSVSQITSVLGATTSDLWQSGLNLLNGATDGAAEPVINKAVSDLQNRIKSLPEEQYQKVKYEFCKDVIEEGQ